MIEFMENSGRQQDFAGGMAESFPPPDRRVQQLLSLIRVDERGTESTDISILNFTEVTMLRLASRLSDCNLDELIISAFTTDRQKTGGPKKVLV